MLPCCYAGIGLCDLCCYVGLCCLRLHVAVLAYACISRPTVGTVAVWPYACMWLYGPMLAMLACGCMTYAGYGTYACMQLYDLCCLWNLCLHVALWLMLPMLHVAVWAYVAYATYASMPLYGLC
jgi:hypothetical protein